MKRSRPRSQLAPQERLHFFMSEASSFALEEGDFIEKASSYDEAFSGAGEGT
ncbi:MAG: hypothetical protein IKP82_08910 [Oscillospiraceae bacterium]|nr:hypothetical protein [Oscillospiraceae bacterium]